MANWVPGNTNSINSGSLVFWVDASDASNYVLDGNSRTDQDVGSANTVSTIYNLGTSGSILGPENTTYPATLITGTISGKNGFRFGYKPAGSGWVSTNFTSSIYPPVANQDRFIIGVMSRMMIDTYPSVAGFKAFFGYGSLGGNTGMSILGDANTDNDSPFASFGFTNLFPAQNLIDETDAALIGFRHQQAGNSNLLFLSGTQIASSTFGLNTSEGANDGMQLGSNYANDNSDVTIHELLIYNLADTETSVTDFDGTFRQILEGYLAHKWTIEGLLPSDHPYKSAAPQFPGGGGGTPTFGEDEGEKLNVNPEGAPDGPLTNRFSAVNNNYGKLAGVEQIPFTLQQPGSFSLKRRPTAYKVTRGDSNE